MGFINDGQIVHVSTSELVEHPKNPREGDVGAVIQSIEANGFYGALLVQRSTNRVLAGNHRLKALRHLGITEAPVIYVDVDDDRALRILLADNRANDLASYDTNALAELLQQVAATELGFDGTLFDGDALDELLADLDPTNAEVEEDEVPEAPAEPITKPGDLWLIGEHRLLCGDSTKADDVERLMDGKQADLMLTDPPYNVDYTGKTKDALKVANDSMADGDFRKFLVACFGAAFDVMKPGASFYVFHADSEGYNFRGAIRDCGQTVRQCLVWVKDTLVMGRQDYQWQHEPCLYGWKEGAAHGWYSDRKQTTLLRFDRPTRSEDHPTMKPVAMFAYLMGNSTAPQGLAYDPFLGSGTTLIAAEQLGRKCYGMEISPAYCDVIVRRWETLTGRKAELDGA